MSFERTRRDLIWFRNDNARNPTLFHRASLAVNQLEHLQSSANARHEQRLRKALAFTTVEIDQVRKNGGKYLPPHHRTGFSASVGDRHEHQPRDGSLDRRDDARST